MNKYQMIIYTDKTKGIYELNSKEEIILGLSLEMITQTAIHFKHKEEAKLSFPLFWKNSDKISPFKVGRQYISIAESVRLISHLNEKITNQALEKIKQLIELNKEINVEIKVNEFKIVTKPADIRDIEGAIKFFNEINTSFLGLNKTGKTLKNTEVVRVDYYEQLENSGLLKEAVIL